MLHCETKHSVNSITSHSLDLIELACSDKVLLNHPAATTAEYLIESKVIVEVVLIDTACRHEVHLGVRSCHSLDLGNTAVLLSREELNTVKTELDSLLYFTGCSCSGNYRYSD